LSHVSESTFADTVDQDTTDDTTPCAVDQDTTDDTTLPTVDQDTTDDTALPGQTCPKCNKLKAPVEFISDKTGRPTVKCRICRAPNPQTVRDNPGKRMVPASRKVADNTKIHGELEERWVSNRVKTGERKAALQNNAAAREMIQKSFGGATK